MSLKVNLGCGTVFIDSDDWINLDYVQASKAVIKADLLSPLPIDSGSVSVVYSSHFLEHVPRTNVPALLVECFRVLKPGGVIRLVVPDLEEMCRQYLSRRTAGEHEKADFVVVEMVDQCVRSNSGGQLGALYQQYSADPVRFAEMIDYVRFRTGESLRREVETETINVGLNNNFFQILKRRIYRQFRGLRRRLGLAFLPEAFRIQNVSLAEIGERHHWLWDYNQLRIVLMQAGFESVESCQCHTSRVKEFPFYPLDVTREWSPRKGAESLYVEANKP